MKPVLLANVVLATLCFGKIDEIELLLSKILEYDMLILIYKIIIIIYIIYI